MVSRGPWLAAALPAAGRGADDGRERGRRGARPLTVGWHPRESGGPATFRPSAARKVSWIPAFAGMTGWLTAVHDRVAEDVRSCRHRGPLVLPLGREWPVPPGAA